MDQTPNSAQTKVEDIKLSSNHLRGDIEKELNDGSDRFSEDTIQLIKFHGFYQQKNRDRTKDENGEDIEKIHTMMLRGRIPGGRLTADQYLGWDRLADTYGDGSFRLTTRQSIQLHSIKKGDIKPVIQEIHKIDLSSIGACGDVVRNVTQALNPSGDPKLAQLDEISQRLSDHFKFTSRAYFEIWLDGERIDSEEEDKIYGSAYLPRKFKIGVTCAGTNHIDLYTNDLGFAATYDTQDRIDGFFLFAGGGLGMTHNKPATYPRVADHFGWIPLDQLIPFSEAVVSVHREYGDRTNRKHARLKYVIAEKGQEWFRSEVEKKTGVKFESRELPPWKTESFLGWKEALDGTYSLGLHTLAGRIKDSEGKPLKTTLANLVSQYRPDIQLTPDQDLILLKIAKENKDEIERILTEKNLFTKSLPGIYHRALACPALPTCGLALTESERVFPELLKDINAHLEELNLRDRAPVIRMTGCPNGCARPYTAEIGIVGQQSGEKYSIFLGGSPEGERIGFLFLTKQPIGDIPIVLGKVFQLWKQDQDKLSLGDFVKKIGVDRLKELLEL
ncbi:MAG: NADPH-dependent assimilatory sulfite reductase hemoprotein subunit [Leptospiraceae bacterium]|nr:NADPH-dependent assimilatory sulfite reductase hemoprotein subunit [Leptospiraceae bacterium]MCP5510289.1 NADPH-dependent assimilatory sulfite reductase hemoprotein subunit [Leptospiraceae bacterium]